MLNTDPDSAWEPLDAVMTVQEERVNLELQQTPDLQPDLVIGPADSESAPPSAMLEAVTSIPESRLDLPRLPPSDIGDRPSTESDVRKTNDLPSRGDRSSGRSGAGMNSGRGGGGRAAFFGQTVPAKSVAYVVDASASMSGARFTRAVNELALALRNLDEDQTFFVVFYTDDSFPLFWPKPRIELISATKQNIRLTMNWLKRSMTKGGTQPQQAMKLALSLKPEVLFLLSDGQIPQETCDLVREQNQGTTIHTIALGSAVGAEALMQIATEHRGQHRFIPDGF